MIYTTRLFGGVAVALVAAIVCAGTACAESLDQALADAWHNNPRMLAARADADAADIDTQTAKRGWYPKLGLEAKLGRQHTAGRIAMFGAPENFDADLDQASASLRLEQPIYEGGKLSAGIAASQSAARASRAQAAASGSQVLLNAVKAYLDVIAAQQLLDIQNDNVKVITDQRDAARNAMRHGEGTSTDVAQANARRQAAIAQRIRVQSQLAQAGAFYRAVIGHAPGHLTLPDSVPQLPDTLQQAEALAGQNFQVQAARYGAASANKRVDEANAAIRPSIHMFASVSRSKEPQFGFRKVNDETIGLSLSMPIWNGGLLRSKAAAARKRANAAQLKTQSARDHARQQVIAAWHDFAAARAALKSDKARLKAARTAASGVTKAHRHGLRTLIDALDAQQEVRNARAAVTHAHRDRIVAAYTLLASTGQLSNRHMAVVAADTKQQP